MAIERSHREQIADAILARQDRDVKEKDSALLLADALLEEFGSGEVVAQRSRTFGLILDCHTGKALTSLAIAMGKKPTKPGLDRIQEVLDENPDFSQNNWVKRLGWNKSSLKRYGGMAARLSAGRRKEPVRKLHREQAKTALRNVGETVIEVYEDLMSVLEEASRS